MEAYMKFVRKNRDFVHSLESLANGFTWLLPERFSNSEIGPEAVYALVAVITSVNQYIIDSQRCASSSFPWSLCASALKDVEAVVEVAAQHFCGEEGKWNFIAVTEAAKALARLALLRDNGYKMLLQGGELVNDDKGQNTLEFHHGQVGNSWRPNGNFGPGHLQGYRGYDPRNLEGRALSALNRFGENAMMASESMWSNKLQYFPDPPATPVQKPSLSSIFSEKGLVGGLFVTAETLFILRPLVYVLFVKKFGVKSWTPWLLSLAVDLTGMGILTHVTRSGQSDRKKFIPLSASEKDEVKRRKLLWALYIMRDPFFTRYTRHRLEKSEKYLSQVPLIGFATGKLVELIVGAQTRYAYISGS